MGLGCFAISHLFGMNYVSIHHLNASDDSYLQALVALIEISTITKRRTTTSSKDPSKHALGILRRSFKEVLKVETGNFGFHKGHNHRDPPVANETSSTGCAQVTFQCHHLTVHL